MAEAGAGRRRRRQVDELERLAKLRSEELLTEDEYAAAKGRLLPRAGA